MLMRDLRTYYTLYCVCMITSGHTRGAVAEEDAVREQQLKWTQLGSSKLKRMQLGGKAAEVYAVEEQQLKRMQSGRSSLSPHETSAR